MTKPLPDCGRMEEGPCGMDSESSRAPPTARPLAARRRLDVDDGGIDARRDVSEIHEARRQLVRSGRWYRRRRAGLEDPPEHRPGLGGQDPAYDLQDPAYCQDLALPRRHRPRHTLEPANINPMTNAVTVVNARVISVKTRDMRDWNYKPTSVRKAASSSTGTPSDSAFASLLPGSAPATT